MVLFYAGGYNGVSLSAGGTTHQPCTLICDKSFQPYIMLSFSKNKNA